jgi:hypothetical protein
MPKTALFLCDIIGRRFVHSSQKKKKVLRNAILFSNKTKSKITLRATEPRQKYPPPPRTTELRRNPYPHRCFY